MGYLSLYRKWRPKNFDDIVGQKTIVQTLKNALINNRIAHAYLFSGPRGTGKTSTARVFAKSLNCHQGPTLEPCELCLSCQQINSGKSIDVIEIDAASNRRIDEIRDLREKVKFLPSEGDYKVYIIDEVHMLTKEAFNALLKTLEEPPENVVFILATTEPHKVISTIQSRCQRFDFSLYSIKDLKARLNYICEQEGIAIGDDASSLIARTAEGGMRDAISILDQVIAYTGDKVLLDDVNTLLGKVDHDVLAGIVKIIAEHNIEAGLSMINQIIDQGKDMNQFVKDLLFHFRDLMLIKECGVSNTINELPRELKNDFAEQAQLFTTQELLRILEVLSDTDQRLKFSSQPRLMLEMAMINLISPKIEPTIANLFNRISRLEEIFEKGQIDPMKSPKIQITEKSAKVLLQKPELSETIVKNESESNKPQTQDNQSIKVELKQEIKDLAALPEIKETVQITMDEMRQHWDVTLNLLNKNTETRKLRAFLLVAKLFKIIGNTLYLVYPQSSKFHKNGAEKEIDILEENLKKVVGVNLKVVCIFTGEESAIQQNSSVAANQHSEITKVQTTQLSEEDIEKNPIVEKALKIFGGKIIRVEDE